MASCNIVETGAKSHQHSRNRCKIDIPNTHIIYVSSNPTRDAYSIQQYVIKFVSDLNRSVVFSGYSGFLQ